MSLREYDLCIKVFSQRFAAIWRKKQPTLGQCIGNHCGRCEYRCVFVQRQSLYVALVVTLMFGWSIRLMELTDRQCLIG